ncbi:MAG: GAF domain-containing protein [Erysipelotrichaceae bacterium]|nr:GAF domain-containing protein [Erysipelotrichaceae bacterium]
MNRKEEMNCFLEQAKALMESEPDTIANLSNITALIKDFYGDRCSWAGFYLMKDGQLVLGPFQGKVACTRIQIGKGVCGTAVKTKTTQIVKNVHEFEGHIACDSGSNSEIVVNLFKNEQVLGVIDLDSYQFETFDEEDAWMLEKLSEIVSDIF